MGKAIKWLSRNKLWKKLAEAIKYNAWMMEELAKQ
jgi:hypothetical protein